ncbi:spore coat protein GerQ [Paenibacillus sp. CAA11]|uniref:spore coat protein GerQ n=1 Tax=Paenibacillus sp. CAA11 TaxID=1532905 RepID=UPI000D37AE07|nr:spore coat protein GerQ [Paenibacillus sp. CAA11]AWB44791.1 spore coat protein GerQ [Paenibacillus sp. CAA11]
MYGYPYRTVNYKTGVPAQAPAPMYGGTMQGGNMPPSVPSGSPMTQGGTVVPQQIPTFEQSYIENILRLNLGKIGTFYMTYENNSQWNAKIFKGVLEAAGRDHIIISDPSTGQRTVLLMVNLDYATFDEPLVYQYPGVIGNPPVTRRY